MSRKSKRREAKEKAAEKDSPHNTAALVLKRMAKTPIELDVDGTIYKLAPLELRHLAELESWTEQQPFVRLRRKLEALGDAPVSDEKKDEMFDEANRISSDPVLRFGELASLSGVAKSLKLSLSVHHPQITDEELNKVLRVYSLIELKDMLDRLTDIPEDEAKN